MRGTYIKISTIENTDKDTLKAITTFPSLPNIIFKVVFLILNIIIPGLGTILISFFGKSILKIHWGIGILQFITSIAIYPIGLLWSITWGILIFINTQPND